MGLLRGGKVNSNQELAENGQLSHRRLAEIALARYALPGAELALINDTDETILYKVSFPRCAGAIDHPYLGRVDGQQLVLRIEDAADRRVASTYSELALLTALLRDTDLALPEPVPSSSGELVPEIWVEGMVSPKQCVLFRWAGIPFPEQALSRAAHWQTN
jgi:hypothetical protein